MKLKNNIRKLVNEKKREMKEITKSKVMARDIQEHLASYCGLKFNGLLSLMNGQATTRVEVAIKIAQYFNKSVEEVFYIDEEGEEK